MKRFAVSQQELGLEVDKRQTTISNWLNKVSEPDISELIKLNQFFGISLDDFAFTDIEKGNLITEDHVRIFKQKGNLKGNPIGKLNTINAGQYVPNNEGKTMANEPEELTMWVVISELRSLSQKVDVVQDSLKNMGKKEPGKGTKG